MIAPALEPLEARVVELIDRLADGRRDDEARDALIVELARAQARSVPPYGRLVASRMEHVEDIINASDVPALPTDVFRFARIASFDEAETTRVFRTSGTTHSSRGAHPFRDLSLYDRACRTAAAHALFGSDAEWRLVIAAPRPDRAPDSSLSYMLGRFDAWFGDDATAWVMTEDGLDAALMVDALRAAETDRAPAVLLGTSFAFVHLEDALANERFVLPPRSRIMQTGGFKGRAREIAPVEMRRILSERYGVPEEAIVAEYGMTELSSQMYETNLVAPDEPRRYWVPGWVRATPVDPETLAPVADGEVGILRIDDLANVESVCAIQTADLARRVGDGFEILGRAADAVPRGCSLAVDAALSGARE